MILCIQLSFDDKDIFTSIDTWLFGCRNGKAAAL